MSSKPEFTYDQWIYGRDQYLDWLSVFLENKKQDPIFLWRSFNLLYVTLLAKKDVEVENDWFKRINERINGYSKPSSINLMSSQKFFIRFVILFIYEYLKLILYKIYFTNSNLLSSSADVYFHSLSSNLQTTKYGTYDRHFFNAPLTDIKFEKKAAYVVALVMGLNDIKNFSKYSKEVKEKLNSLKRQFVLLNNYTSFSTINEVYFSLFSSWRMFRKEARKLSFQKNFDINNCPCADILIPEIEKSFLGEIQWSLIYGLSFQNWIQKEKIQAPVITYGETLSPMRPVYYFSKLANPSILFLSIQHSTTSRNKMGLYHRKKEFMSAINHELVDFMLLPDYYLVQGDQFREISKEFYPSDRTAIIGCLKYDNIILQKGKPVMNKKMEIDDQYISKAEKVILIAPSVNDAASLIQLFRNPIFTNWRIILRPHPANDIDKIREMVVQANTFVPIEVITDLSTADLFSIASLVVCGYSASCYEALIQSISAVQYMNLQSIPLMEPDPKIPFFTSREDFWEWFTKFDNAELNSDILKIADNITQKYFHKMDGCSSLRLWEFVRSLNN
jgi:hypothetical protein